jgi:precorrin-6B methylase 2
LKIIDKEDTLKKWNIYKLEKNDNEFEALKFIKKYSENLHTYICYFHLKGVVSEQIEPNVGIPTWRKYLNYFTINKWKENVEALKNNDVVCVDWNFNDMHQRYVLGGHFFWTKSEYIRTLSEPVSDENRFLSEIWITSNPNVKVHENFNYEKIGYKNLYLQYFDPSLYRNDIDNIKIEENWTKKNITDITNVAFSRFGAQQNKWEYEKFFERLLELEKTDSVLEIGAKYGASSYGFCNIFNKVVSIDISKENTINDIENKFDNYTFILGDSHSSDTKNKLKEMKFDVVFIDGDHSYDAVKQDYLDYKEFCKDEGIIVFHDIKHTTWTDSVGIQVPVLWKEIKYNYKYEEIINNENDCFGIGILFNKAKYKTAYVITSHPNYKMSEDITKKTVHNLKLMGEKVILSAHCPTDRNIQGLVDYFIYDKNNPLIKHDFFTQSWFPHEDYYAHLNITKFDNNLNHALGVFLNYYNSLILAKQQGFNIAVCTNFDMIFSAEDKKKIDAKIEEMIRTGKKAFFMNTPEREGTHYKTIFFITNIDYFLNTFEYLSNEQVYMKEMIRVGSSTNCLENFFYHTLKDKTNDLLLQEINEDQLFPTSQINLFSLIEYNTILSVENEPNCFVVWFSSANSLDSREMNITIIKNGSPLLSGSMTIDKKFIYFKKIRFTQGDVFDINFKVTNLDEVLKNKTITVNDEVFADIQSYGKFIDKKGIETL